jgi:hypothetical protein
LTVAYGIGALARAALAAAAQVNKTRTTKFAKGKVTTQRRRRRRRRQIPSAGSFRLLRAKF